MKILFMGTPDFAKAHLEALLNSRHNVVAVISQPDKPKGRKKLLSMPPVKECALSFGIPVYQPETLKDGSAEEILNMYNPDIIVVVAYGKILPEYILNFPRYGCINVHGSLLPSYRGAAPVQRALIDGLKETGVTVMYMDKGLDTGDMILKKKCEIAPDDDQITLFSKLESLGKEALLEALDKIENNTADRIKQDDKDANYAQMLTSDTGKIDWTKDADTVHNLIRGTYPWPTAFSYLGGKKLKITKSAVCDEKGKPGEVKSVGKDGITVCCLEGAVIIKRLKMEGGKEMDAGAFLLGHKIEPGTFFGIQEGH